MKTESTMRGPSRPIVVNRLPPGTTFLDVVRPVVRELSRKAEPIVLTGLLRRALEQVGPTQGDVEGGEHRS